MEWRKLASALAMPQAERYERWSALMRVVKQSSIHSWFSDFLEELSSAASAFRATQLDSGEPVGIPVNL
jgi:trehalose-6-phosphate synthase